MAHVATRLWGGPLPGSYVFAVGGLRGGLGGFRAYRIGTDVGDQFVAVGDRPVGPPALWLAANLASGGQAPLGGVAADVLARTVGRIQPPPIACCIIRCIICRLWRGWATKENADAYERIVRGQVIPGIEAQRIPGFRSSTWSGASETTTWSS